jgi:hypothetical protein
MSLSVFAFSENRTRAVRGNYLAVPYRFRHSEGYQAAKVALPVQPLERDRVEYDRPYR